MARGKPSGISLSKSDVEIVLGMEVRGDRNHDIAAWFGVNQGRIAEAKQGEYGTLVAASADKLPPSGLPGVKGRRLRSAADQVVVLIQTGDAAAAGAALKNALAEYDANEA